MTFAEVRPYPAYRDSGVPWLGKVPEQWEAVRTRYLLREIDQRSLDGTETHLSMSQKLGLVPTSMVQQRTLVSESYAGGKLCEQDDIVLNRLKAHLGVFALAQQNGVISPDYTVLRKTRPMTVKYFEYVLKSPACRSELRVRAKGIVEGFWRLYTDDLYDIRLPVPSVVEQAAIVRFLGHADRRIRRYIAAKKKLIALLNEQKQAVIHRAVTRGLDPAVRLKPSGVEWLGDVPEHWDVRRIGTCVESLSTGLWGDDPSDANSVDHITCVRVADFDTDRMEVTQRRLTIRALSSAARQSRILKPGDILMEKSGGGDAEPVGRVVRFSLPQPSVCSNFVVRLRPAPAMVRSEYLLYVLTHLQSSRRNVPSIKQTTGIQNLDTRHYLANLIAVPPLDEQDAILIEADASLTTLRRADELARSEIDLLGEYRARLIADVVTGKLDVRDAAAQLSDEVELLDAADAILDGDESDDEADLDTVAGEVMT